MWQWPSNRSLAQRAGGSSSQMGETGARGTCAHPRPCRTDFLGGHGTRCQGLGHSSKEEALASVTQREAGSTYDLEDRGAGWLVFASAMLGLVGILAVIDGVVALSKSKFYVADATYVFSDLRTWGWITLIIGAFAIVAAMGVLSGSQFGRWFGMIAASVIAIDQFVFA